MNRIVKRNTLRTEHNCNGHRFRVIENWILHSLKLGKVIIKAGFWTDYATIPRMLWWLFDPLDYREEGTYHDWLYKEQVINGKSITRKQADQELYEFVLQNHDKKTARTFYWGVRIGGSKPWNEYRKDK
jgi:hypothetical protein